MTARRAVPKSRTFKRVLIANRGEIAVRIAQTLRDLAIEPIGVFTGPDAAGFHVRAMARAVQLDALGEGRGYLDVAALVDAARLSGAEAIHPGYGFVSENPELAAACERAGITLIGPSAHAISTMGSKTRARAAMQQAQVPVIPGSRWALQTVDEAVICAEGMGFPVMLKAAAGGGGKGIRIVEQRDELAGALRAVRSEARGAFGDETVYMEKALVDPRHIEVQIMADRHGQVFAVGERECSMQRRHQKIIEEAPAACLTPTQRQRLGELACQAARAVDYVGAGTVEFLLDRRGELFFLEMNTRLQVEHPVTELCHGVDLVALQVAVASGARLEPDVLLQPARGHAIEARLYAEDPLRDFLPSPGRIDALSWPAGPGIRVDAGVAAGSEVTTLFDPMVAKIMAWGPTRERARRRLVRALSETHVRGLTTNQSYLLSLLESAPFVSGDYHTHSLERLAAPAERRAKDAAQDAALVALVVARHLKDQQRHRARASARAGRATASSWGQAPWLLEGS